MTQERTIELHGLVGLQDTYPPVSLRFSEEVADYLEALEVVVNQIMRNLQTPEPPTPEELWSPGMAETMKAGHERLFRGAERAAELLKTIEAVLCPPAARQVQRRVVKLFGTMIRAIQLQKEGWEIWDRDRASPMPDASRRRFQESRRLNLEEVPRLTHNLLDAIDALSEGQLSASLGGSRSGGKGGNDGVGGHHPGRG